MLATLLAGALGAGLVIQRAALVERLDRQVAADHRQERDELRVLAAGRDPRTGEPFGDDAEAVFTTFFRRNLPGRGEVYIAIVDGVPARTTASPVRFTADSPAVREWAAVEDGQRGETDTATGPLRWDAVALRGSDGDVAGVFVVGTFLADAQAEVDDTLRVEALVSALVLLVALAVSWAVAGRLLRPVRAVTDNARALSEQGLSSRIPVRGDDELADLARTYNAMLDRLEEAFATQRRFLDDAGHELRTPITIIQGHLELMGDDPEEQRETVALVTDELERMARMVNDLLELAKVEQPHFLTMTAVDVAPLTDGILGRSRALGDRRWVVDEVAEGFVVADDQRLTQAVLNLARNAVEHTTPGAEVAIGSRAVDGTLHLWVRDTGPGVPAEERDRLFERFARGRQDRSSGEGAGLGLAIVRAIAEAHGGRVTVGDAPGGGAVFTLVLPRFVPHEPPPASPDDPTRPGLDHPRPEEATWPGS